MKPHLLLFKMFALVAALTCALGANAYDFYTGGIYYIFSEDLSGVEVYRGDGEYGTSYSGVVNIPSTVQYGGRTYDVLGIFGNAFKSCTDLTGVTIPASVQRVGWEAFYNCTNLNSIICLASTPPYFFDIEAENPDLYPFSDITYNNATLYVPKGCKSAYQVTGHWKYWYRFRNIVEMPWDFVVNGIYYAITGTNTVKVTYRDTNYNSYSGSVSIPSSVSNGGKTYTVTAIGNYAFHDCSNLTSVTIPNTVTTIGLYSFYDSPRLSSVTFGNSLTTIGQGAFMECTGLTSVTIPNSVTTIMYQAFYNCTGLTSVTFGNSLNVIGPMAFEGCKHLTSVTIPNSVTTIGEMAFYYCTGLKSVALPNTITTIEPRCFLNTGLTSVTIPNSVTTIGEDAFRICTSLTSVTIGSSVTNIKDRAFYGCPILMDVKCKASTPPTMAAKTVFDDAVYSDPDHYSVLRVPEGTKSAYESANWWKDFRYIVEESYDFVVNGIYYHITGTNTVEVATKDALLGKTYSGAVSIPSSVTYGGVTYTVTGIGPKCFAFCSLTSLTLPNTITVIGNGAFGLCSGLGNLTLPSSLTEIGASAFGLCADLTRLIIPNSVTYIGDNAFAYCRYLTSLTLPSSLVYLGSSAFFECSSLTTVVIPNNVTTINRETFKGCEALTSVTLGNAVTSIGYEAFAYCSSLTSFTIPYSVTSIGSNAFDGCTALATINCLPTTPPTIRSGTFTSDQYTTVTLMVPNGCKSDYQAADYWKNFTTIQERDYDFIVNGIYYRITGSKTVSVCHGPNNNCYSGNVTIPSTVTNGGVTYSVTRIAGDAFRGQYNITNDKLTGVIIPISVTTIEKCAFMTCTQLTSVAIPATVDVIGYQAFMECSALQSVTLGEGITFIDFWAFKECPNLTSITCLASEPPTTNSGSFTSENNNSAILFVPKASLGAYQSINYWNEFPTIKPHLEYVLNTEGGTIKFATSFIYPWTNIVEGDRVYARSGNQGVHSSTSLLLADVTLAQAGTLSFDYKAWGEGENYDVCIFAVDGTEMFRYGSKQNSWVNYTVPLTAGTHTLAWCYQKDGSVNPEGDYFALDNIVININTIRGDVDGDGQVTIADVTEMLDLILVGGASVDAYPSADVDGDGQVTIADATGLIDYLLVGTWDDEPSDAHEWVDLGLPSGTLWATCNVGASSPEEYGDYFAWGEIEPKGTYDWTTYKWCNGSSTSLTKYCTTSIFGTVDNKTELDPEDDAAYVNWGVNWRMPTKEQQQELYVYCTSEWTTMGGVNGLLMTGPNGNTLFLPAPGYRWSGSLYDEGTDGYYWSRSLGSTGSYDPDDPDAGYDPGDAFNIYFYMTSWYEENSSRRTWGCAVRPVRVSR